LEGQSHDFLDLRDGQLMLDPFASGDENCKIVQVYAHRFTPLEAFQTADVVLSRAGFRRPENRGPEREERLPLASGRRRSTSSRSSDECPGRERSRSPVCPPGGPHTSRPGWASETTRQCLPGDQRLLSRTLRT